jgi:hypothetical protein
MFVLQEIVLNHVTGLWFAALYKYGIRVNPVSEIKQTVLTIKMDELKE